MIVEGKYKSPLHQTAVATATDFWNDSCSVAELRHAIEHGASGATTNPTIVTAVLKQEFAQWRPRLQQLIAELPGASEVEIAWRLNEAMAMEGAQLLLPQFEESVGARGFISIQTNAQFSRSADELVKQARHFSSLAPNIMVKLPVTQAGVEAVERSIYQGINTNATVCFSVPQALAVAEAVERGLKARQAEGKSSAHLHPVCTIMVGRLDDWLKVVAEREGIIATPGLLEWAGVAVMKQAYRLFCERGYRCRLLVAAYRNHYHWSEFIGGDVVLTIPPVWQRRFNNSDVEVRERMDQPVDRAVLEELQAKFPDFSRAYSPTGMKEEEFDSFGATRRTLRSFLEGYAQLLALVRDQMVPDPDKG